MEVISTEFNLKEGTLISKTLHDRINKAKKSDLDYSWDVSRTEAYFVVEDLMEKLDFYMEKIKDYNYIKTDIFLPEIKKTAKNVECIIESISFYENHMGVLKVKLIPVSGFIIQ